MQKTKRTIILAFIIIFALLSGACAPATQFESTAPEQTIQQGNSEAVQGEIAESGNLRITFVSVGKGDAMVITTPDGKNMLLDAGDPPDAKKVLKYMKKEGIDRLDAVVATHPHSDHIGGMQEVLEAKEWDNIYMPNQSHTTETYIDLLNYLKNSGKNVHQAIEGAEFDLGEFVKIKFYSPEDKEYEDLNQCSAVIRMTYGENSFLFMGDAEKPNEQVILKNHKNEIHSDVIKVGHHGSHTSSGKKFLEDVDPEYAVITTGKKNPYGHPHKETIETLGKLGINILRTDEMGTIELYSDGKYLTVKTEK